MLQLIHEMNMTMTLHDLDVSSLQVKNGGHLFCDQLEHKPGPEGPAVDSLKDRTGQCGLAARTGRKEGRKAENVILTLTTACFAVAGTGCKGRAEASKRQ